MTVSPRQRAIGKHPKGEFKLTRHGAELADGPGELLASLIPSFVLETDYASYARLDERPFGKWDTWLNVINVEAEHGRSEQALFAAFSLGVLAGAPGFEPGNAGTKNRCLTTWRRPNLVPVPTRFGRAVQHDLHRV